MHDFIFQACAHLMLRLKQIQPTPNSNPDIIETNPNPDNLMIYIHVHVHIHIHVQWFEQDVTSPELNRGSEGPICMLSQVCWHGKYLQSVAHTIGVLFF